MDMQDTLRALESLPLSAIFKGVVLLVAGFLLASLVRRLTQRIISNMVNLHTTTLMMRFSYYLVLGIFLLTALHQFGFEINTLLGLAGFFTIALGFATQTAASNLISGFFMLGEKPFQIGDYIHVDRFEGEVIAIDLLSTKLRKSNNTMVRIPNEALIKTSVINLSRFPTRRCDVILHVDTHTPLETLQHLFLKLAEELRHAITVPAPEFYVLGFEEHGVKVQCCVWTPTTDYLAHKNHFMMQLHQRCLHEGIKFATPTGVTHSEK